MREKEYQTQLEEKRLLLLTKQQQQQNQIEETGQQQQKLIDEQIQSLQEKILLLESRLEALENN